MDRIYVEEDDKAIYDELKLLLEANGYEVVTAPPCELALIDINLDGASGFEICRNLRKQHSFPIIFLTARTENRDELMGFALGADDYIRKPYDSSVLLARIARLLKKREETVLKKKGLTLHLDTLHVMKDGKETELTKNEARILALLMKKDVSTEDEIISYMWDDSLYIDSSTLYVNLNRLRGKLKEVGADDCIVNIRGVGYRL